MENNYFTSQHKYNQLSLYLEKRFNRKIFKVALNGNFTCPNRDGKISTKGCIFCSPSGSGDYGGNKNDDLRTQFDTVRTIIHQKWKSAGYIVYFQANTNTYKPLEELKKLYQEAISLDENIVCISIATRPDCLQKEILDYLEQLNKKIPVWIELGLQTAKEDTIKLINRGYDNSVFEEAIKNLNARNIETIVHIINGLPNETYDDMINTIHYLNNFNIQGIKIHSLFVLNNTYLYELYKQNAFKMLSLEEYVKVTSNQLSILKDNVIIHRINGDAPVDSLVAPMWSLKKLVVMNEIDKYMKVNNLYQGCKYKK